MPKPFWWDSFSLEEINIFDELATLLVSAYCWVLEHLLFLYTVDWSLYVAKSKIKEAGTWKCDRSCKLVTELLPVWISVENWAIEQFPYEVSRFGFSPFSFNIVFINTISILMDGLISKVLFSGITNCSNSIYPK